MPGPYPYVMTFTLPKDSRYRLAVEAAARDLHLPITIDDETHEIRVTVSNPGEAFRFGEETSAHLEATKP